MAAIQALQRFDVRTLASAAQRVDPCARSELRVHKGRLSASSIGRLLAAAPPIEMRAEQIRFQSHDQITLEEMTRVDAESVAAARELTASDWTLSGFEYIQIRKVAEADVTSGIWHVDPGFCPRMGRIMLILQKTGGDGGNFDFVAPTTVEAVAADLAEAEVTGRAPRSPNSTLKQVLTALQCTQRLDPGDVLHFPGNTYHRTQNDREGRISIQVTG